MFCQSVMYFHTPANSLKFTPPLFSLSNMAEKEGKTLLLQLHIWSAGGGRKCSKISFTAVLILKRIKHSSVTSADGLTRNTTVCMESDSQLQCDTIAVSIIELMIFTFSVTLKLRFSIAVSYYHQIHSRVINLYVSVLFNWITEKLQSWKLFIIRRVTVLQLICEGGSRYQEPFRRLIPVSQRFSLVILLLAAGFH